MLILDTDASSVLAKGEIIEETLELFSNHQVAITPKIEEEVERPLEYGYSYPEKILRNVEVTNIREEEKDKYREWFEESSVDKGELEATVVAKDRDAIFFTMDQQAKRFAEKKRVQTLSINNLIKLLIQKDFLSKEEVNSAVEKIEERDNREINTDEALEEK
ncbi:MAG: hypothetical protein ABEK16_03550 [Candidatus Nanohalobium sp.]